MAFRIEGLGLTALTLLSRLILHEVVRARKL